MILRKDDRILAFLEYLLKFCQKYPLYETKQVLTSNHSLSSPMTPLSLLESYLEVCAEFYEQIFNALYRKSTDPVDKSLNEERYHDKYEIQLGFIIYRRIWVNVISCCCCFIGVCRTLSIYLSIYLSRRGESRGVVAKVLEHDTVVSSNSCCSITFTFGLMPLGKVWVPLSSQI